MAASQSQEVGTLGLHAVVRLQCRILRCVLGIFEWVAIIMLCDSREIGTCGCLEKCFPMQVHSRGSDYQEAHQLTDSISTAERRATDVTTPHSLAGAAGGGTLISAGITDSAPSSSVDSNRHQGIQLSWPLPDRSSVEVKFSAESISKQAQAPAVPSLLSTSMAQASRAHQQSAAFDYPIYSYQAHYQQQAGYRYPATFSSTYPMSTMYQPGSRTAILDVPQPPMGKDVLVSPVLPAVYPMEEKRYILSEPPPSYPFNEYGSGFSAQDAGYSDYYGYYTNTNGVSSHVFYTQCVRDRTSVSSLSPTPFDSGMSLQSPTSLLSGRKRAMSASAAEGKRMNLATAMLPGLSDLEPKVGVGVRGCVGRWSCMVFVVFVFTESLHLGFG